MLRIVKPSTEAQKTTHTTLDTIEVTLAIIESWKLPPFQRPLKANTKVVDLAQEIARDQIIPGTLTLGVLRAGGRNEVYIVDGQHRVHAFKLAEVESAFADVRYVHFDSLAEMGDEFVKLNSHLVVMKPDDIMRGLEASNDALQKLRAEFPAVGYDNIRRGPSNPVVSMSALLRCWFGSQHEVPTTGGISVKEIVNALTPTEVEPLIDFCKLAFKAFGKDPEHGRLWTNLNLTVCMWLYRRLVITGYSSVTKKLSREMYSKCLMSVAADGDYHDWLLGRALTKRDKGPAYSKVKGMFARRIEAETGERPRLPSPEWSSR
jgi:hypothetical protein